MVSSLMINAKGRENDTRMVAAGVKETATAGDRVMDENHLREKNDQVPSLFRRLVRLVATASLLWLIESGVVLWLKNLGYIDPKFTFEDVVADKVMHQRDDPFTPEQRRPGYKLRQQGVGPKYPVVVVPGFATSGLEVWDGKECARKYFRRRLWAAMLGAKSFLTDRECFLEHMSLDPFTGSDPEGIRLRAAQGFEAADYFIWNFWVFGKLIENLADIGYTPSLMSMEPYDWRLSFPMLQERDGYLTHLKHKIEAMHRFSGEKIVLTSHSMGSLLVHYFFAWVTRSERDGGGGGGRMWVDQHVHAYVNIAGPLLGVPKAATALLSGEMSDTVLGGTIGDMVEQFFGRRTRRDLWASWGSLWTMLPMGGDNLWHSTPFLQVSGVIKPRKTSLSSELRKLSTVFESTDVHNISSTVNFIRAFGAAHGNKLANVRLVSGERQWSDPTITPLPHAPRLKIFCLYGTGVLTERAYHYQRNQDKRRDESGIPLVLDDSVEDPGRNIKFGIKYEDGDGSVPLVSLGYMCADAWQRSETGLNPSKIPVYTREYLHEPGFTVDDPMRGGPRSTEHVDILGHDDVMLDLLRVATGFELDQVETDRIESEIMDIAKRANANEGTRQKRNKYGFL